MNLTYFVIYITIWILTKEKFHLRIALFTDSFLPGIGGTENVVLKLATELSKDHQVMVVAPNYHKYYDDGALPFKVVRARSIKVSKNECWALPGVGKRVKKALDEFKPEVLHAHTLGMMAGYANKYAKKNNLPVVCTVHTKFKYCFDQVAKFPPLVKFLLNRIMKRANKADIVTSVSNSMIPELNSYGLKKPVTIIRNGNDPKQKKEINKTPNQKFTLLYVGMIINYKNLGFSLTVLQELKKINDNFVFYMVGRGAHEKKYKKLIKKLGLENNVIMTGAITDRNKLTQIYNSADLLLFTSIFDNDSLVLIEAAENGVPAIVLENTGSAERFVDGQTGFMASNDKKLFAQKIASLMQNRELLTKVGERALEICITWDTILREYEQVYQKAIDLKK